MIRKIISGGRSGVERAALDVAVKFGISHGGWTSRGMRAIEGRLPSHYGLKETPVLGFNYAMEQNVIESQGVLLFTRGARGVETRYAVETALRHQRQLLHVDLTQRSYFEAASLTISWIELQRISEVFITGPAADDDPEIYGQVVRIVETALYLEFVKSGLHPQPPLRNLDLNSPALGEMPETIEQAVARIKEQLTLKDLATICKMRPNELDQLLAGLGTYIKEHFGLLGGNAPLLQSCAQAARISTPLPDEACVVILRALWQQLQTTHKLRLVSA